MGQGERKGDVEVSCENSLIRKIAQFCKLQNWTGKLTGTSEEKGALGIWRHQEISANRRSMQERERKEGKRGKDKDHTVEIRPWDGHRGGYSVTRRLKLACYKCARVSIYVYVSELLCHARTNYAYIYLVIWMRLDMRSHTHRRARARTLPIDSFGTVCLNLKNGRFSRLS